MKEFNVINSRVPRVDARAKVTGDARYTADLSMPNMLYGALLQSPHAHAKILNIDTSAAKKLIGVKEVVTAKEASPIKFGLSPARYDEMMFCMEKVRYVGDEIAAVAAARLAQRLVEVSQALEEDSPEIAEQLSEAVTEIVGAA